MSHFNFQKYNKQLTVCFEWSGTVSQLDKLPQNKAATPSLVCQMTFTNHRYFPSDSHN